MKTKAVRTIWWQGGFTIVEILVVVSIIGLLAAIVYPSYSSYIVKSRVAEATSALADLRYKSERFYQATRSYVKQTKPGGMVCGVPAADTHYFSFNCTGSATTFTWVASSKPGAGMGDEGSYQFSIDEQGNMATLYFAGKAVDESCWLSSAGKC